MHDLFDNVRYYDINGEPTEREYRVRPIEDRRVARTDGLTWEGRPAYVSTVLVPGAIVIMGPELDKPFETALRTADTESPIFAVQLPTRADAEAFHHALVTLVCSSQGREALSALYRNENA
jgi:hypothetical protein